MMRYTIYSKKDVRLTPLMWSRHNLIFKLLKSHLRKAGSACLEIGCGTGNLLPELEKWPFSRIKAVDMSQDNAAIARTKASRAEVYCDSLFNIKEKFDLVIMLEVLEHVEDDETALSHIANNLLSEDGLLVLSVPSHNSSRELDFGHYRYYRRDDLKSLLARSGFKILSFYSYGTRLIDRLGVMVLKKRYGIKGAANRSIHGLTEKSANLDFPLIWGRLIYPILRYFYPIFYLIDYHLLKDTDSGVDYLVLCEKKSEGNRNTFVINES